MKRILSVAGGLLLLLIILSLLIDGTFRERKYKKAWSESYKEQFKDVSLKIVAGAMQAASSHNMQPWKVKIAGVDQVELYADMDKVLPVIDHENRQMIMSQGTFIEAFEHHAALYGYKVTTTLSNLDLKSDRPLIARFSLSKDSTLKEVVDASSGASYKSDLEEKEKNLEAKMNSIINPFKGLSYDLYQKEELIGLKKYLSEGNKIESSHEEAMKELLNVFRWTENDKNKYRNGLTITSLSPMLRPFVQAAMKVMGNDWSSFGKAGIDAFEKRLEKEEVYLLVKSKDNEPIEYLNAGRIYQKMIYEISGYSIRPAIQVTESYKEMVPLKESFNKVYGKGDTVVMVIGFQGKRTNVGGETPRHLVEDILVK